MTDAAELHALRRYYARRGQNLPKNRYILFRALIRFRIARIPQPQETLWSMEMREHTRMAYQAPYHPEKI